MREPPWGPWAHLKITLDTHPGTSTCHLLVVATRWRGSTPNRRVLLRCVVPEPLSLSTGLATLLRASRILLRGIHEELPQHDNELD
jgi:hypothetical protein